MRKLISNLFKSTAIKFGINPRFFMDDKSFIRSVAMDLLHEPRIFGDSDRLHIGNNVVLNDALINLSSGKVVIGDFVFTGHGVSFLTGTHDMSKIDKFRQETIPHDGRDIVVMNGVWIASNATIIGPCTIGQNAVIAAGALVVGDVPPNAIYAGVPAIKVGDIKYE